MGEPRSFTNADQHSRVLALLLDKPFICSLVLAFMFLVLSWITLLPLYTSTSVAVLHCLSDDKVRSCASNPLPIVIAMGAWVPLGHSHLMYHSGIVENRRHKAQRSQNLEYTSWHCLLLEVAKVLFNALKCIGGPSNKCQPSVSRVLGPT